MSLKRSAQYWIDLLTDPLTYICWDPGGGVADRSVRGGAPRRGGTGHDSVMTGRAAIDGSATAVVVMDYSVQAGTLTVDSASRIASAFDRATDEGLPVVGVANSGGVRLQQGAAAFVKMASMAAAVGRHRMAALPYVCYLANPTTGGALASWAGLPDLSVAEPSALVAFAGPRVVQLLGGVSYAGGSVTSEQLQEQGLVDAVVPPDSVKEYLSTVLRVHASVEPGRSPTAMSPPTTQSLEVGPGTPWAAVTATRAVSRPGAREVVQQLSDVTLLHGDGMGGGDDPACLAGLGTLAGTPIVFVGHDRAGRPGGAAITAAGLRKAQRALALAQQLHLPLVSLIDTPGAQLGTASELSGLGLEIARALVGRAEATTPLLSVLLGEGAGGAALAFLPADVVIAASNAWLAPLSPEGASAVLHHTIERASEVISQQGVTASDLRRITVADYVVAESGDWISRIVELLAGELQRLIQTPFLGLIADRRVRLAAIGGSEGMAFRAG